MLLDSVIILGGVSDGNITKFRNEASFNSSAERLIKSFELFHKNRDLKIFFSSFQERKYRGLVRLLISKPVL